MTSPAQDTGTREVVESPALTPAHDPASSDVATIGTDAIQDVQDAVGAAADSAVMDRMLTPRRRSQTRDIDHEPQDHRGHGHTTEQMSVIESLAEHGLSVRATRVIGSIKDFNSVPERYREILLEKSRRFLESQNQGVEESQKMSPEQIADVLEIFKEGGRSLSESLQEYFKRRMDLAEQVENWKDVDMFFFKLPLAEIGRSLGRMYRRAGEAAQHLCHSVLKALAVLGQDNDVKPYEFETKKREEKREAINPFGESATSQLDKVIAQVEEQFEELGDVFEWTRRLQEELQRMLENLKPSEDVMVAADKFEDRFGFRPLLTEEAISMEDKNHVHRGPDQIVS